MKNVLRIFFLAALAGSFLSCRDKCKETRVVIKEIPIIHPFSEIRNGVKVLAPQDIQDPGKMYTKGDYLFINEIGKGIHIVNNSDPSNPLTVSFIQIPGNGDFDFLGNNLYADSYCDIVTLDISDPIHTKEIGRVNNVYTVGWFNKKRWVATSEGLNLSETTKEYLTEVVDVDCDLDPVRDEMPTPDISSIDEPFLPKTIARLVVQDSYLYSVHSFGSLEIFNLQNAARPDSLNTISVDPILFTIFSYQNKLLLSSDNGSVVYDNSDPRTPQKISAFPGGSPCDKTVFQNDVAYLISLRGGYCGSAVSKLDLIGIGNLSMPSLIKSYPMQSPQGLALDFPTLYICEGTNGFKVFDVTDKMKVDKNLLLSNTSLHANDVILSGKTVIVNAEDGIYQFDGSDPKNLKQLSKIPVKKAV